MPPVEEVSREAIVAAARKAAEENGGVLSKRDFTRLTGMRDYLIYRLFPEGGWPEVLRLAGLPPHPKHMESLSDEDLVAELHRVLTALGKVPSQALFDAKADVSSVTLRKRFGSWEGALKHYLAWLEAHEPTSPLLPLLQERSGHPLASSAPETGTAARAWKKGEGIEYGAPINFRGLRHAPINEQGVVYIFGMVSHELGFLVEAIHTSYPDCEAKRRISKTEERWQRVRVEFEYRSRNFWEHGHDPAACDLIVCWDHDWPECPLEVIELRRVIEELKG